MRKLLTVSAVLVLAASCGGSGGTTGGTCRNSGECGPGSVCLAAGVCAAKCITSNDCLAEEKCSTSGGCVPKNGCGADAECSTGNVCDALACVASCVPGSCASGRTCQVDGHCSQPGADGGTASCGGELFQATRVQANFLIVLDQSCSMGETLPAGGTKWNLATAALQTVTTQNQSEIRFGLSMFPGAAKCAPGSNFVPVGDQTAGAIAGAFPAQSTGTATPIGAALLLAAQRPELTDLTRANYVLLVTDGMENCNGDPVAAVTAMAARGIKTYVVGFGTEVDAARLALMAIEGGTARLTTPRYYQADDQATLNSAFKQIAAGAAGCDYKLTKTPPDVNKIYVAVDGNLINHDPNKQMGWEYNPTTGRLTLYGGACDVVQKSTSPKVQIVYGCPDPTLIEGGGKGDGGYPPVSYDGGIT